MVLIENKTNIKLTFEKPSINIINENKELKIISDLLTGICLEKKTTTNNNVMKSFLTKKIPSISIYDFLERIVKYSKIEKSTLVLILIYIDKLCDMNNVDITFYNIHKLILSSLVIAAKYNEDKYLSNQFFAKIGGITKKEIDILEYQFLTLIDFSLYINDEIYYKYEDFIQKEGE